MTLKPDLKIDLEQLAAQYAARMPIRLGAWHKMWRLVIELAEQAAEMALARMSSPPADDPPTLSQDGEESGADYSMIGTHCYITVPHLDCDDEALVFIERTDAGIECQVWARSVKGFPVTRTTTAANPSRVTMERTGKPISMTIQLKANVYGGISCPKCRANLEATVRVIHSGVHIYPASDQGYFNQMVGADTDDSSGGEYNITDLYCTGGCGWEWHDEDKESIEIVKLALEPDPDCDYADCLACPSYDAKSGQCMGILFEEDDYGHDLRSLPR